MEKVSRKPFPKQGHLSRILVLTNKSVWLGCGFPIPWKRGFSAVCMILDLGSRSCRFNHHQWESLYPFIFPSFYSILSLCILFVYQNQILRSYRVCLSSAFNIEHVLIAYVLDIIDTINAPSISFCNLYNQWFDSSLSWIKFYI